MVTEKYGDFTAMLEYIYLQIFCIMGYAFLQTNSSYTDSKFWTMSLELHLYEKMYSQINKYNFFSHTLQ